MQRHVLWVVIFCIGGITSIVLINKYLGETSFVNSVIALADLVASGAAATVLVAWIFQPDYDKELIAGISLLESIAAKDEKSEALTHVTPAVLISELKRKGEVSLEFREIIRKGSTGDKWAEDELRGQLDRIRRQKTKLQRPAS